MPQAGHRSHRPEAPVSKFGHQALALPKDEVLDRLITNVQAGISPGDQNRALVKSVEELEEQKRRMEECQNLDLDEDTKRLQQAFSKANHKARRMAQMPEANGLNGLLALSGKDPNSVGPKSTSGSASPPSISVDTALNAARAQVELLKGVAGVAESVGNGRHRLRGRRGCGGHRLGRGGLLGSSRDRSRPRSRLARRGNSCRPSGSSGRAISPRLRLKRR